MFNGFPKPVPEQGGGNLIKSIQRGTLTFPSATITNVTISSVDLTKSIVLVTSIGDSVNPAVGCVKGKLTSATNLALSKATTLTANVSWQVIEFYNVKSLQTGDYTLITAAGTVTVSAVSPTKSLLICSWESTASTSGANYAALNYNLTNSTTITFDIINSANQGRNIHWQLIEFN